MAQKERNEAENSGRLSVGAIVLLLVLAVGFFLLFYFNPFIEENGPDAEIASDTLSLPKADTLTDQETGLILDSGWELVKVNCTGCHSPALVTQNRATREGWEGMIRWMQRTQKLWDLGENEQAILDYLAKNYAPEDKGRRENLKDIEWYELEEPPVTGSQ